MGLPQIRKSTKRQLTRTAMAQPFILIALTRRILMHTHALMISMNILTPLNFMKSNTEVRVNAFILLQHVLQSERILTEKKTQRYLLFNLNQIKSDELEQTGKFIPNHYYAKIFITNGKMKLCSVLSDFKLKVLGFLVCKSCSVTIQHRWRSNFLQLCVRSIQ